METRHANKPAHPFSKEEVKKEELPDKPFKPQKHTASKKMEQLSDVDLALGLHDSGELEMPMFESDENAQLEAAIRASLQDLNLKKPDSPTKSE